MVLTNGDKYDISSNTATPTGSESANRWAYYSESFTATETVKIYINDVLQFTTSIDSGTYYPMIKGNIGAGETSTTGDISNSTYTTWTINSLPVDTGNLYFGFRTSTGDELAANWTCALHCDHRTWATVFQSGSGSAINNQFTASADDVVKITFGEASTTGTRLPPPPIRLTL
jgi:hypothetical protein